MVVMVTSVQEGLVTLPCDLEEWEDIKAKLETVINFPGEYTVTDLVNKL